MIYPTYDRRKLVYFVGGKTETGGFLEPFAGWKEGSGGMQENDRATRTKAAGRIQSYVKSHIWCTFAAVIGAAVLLLLLVLMFYMRGQYYRFLLQTTYSTQEALLDTVNENLETLLDGYVATGAGICVDSELLHDTNFQESVEEYIASPRGAGDKQRMKSALKVAGNVSNRIVGVAIADADGILYQYDKYEISAPAKIDLWNDQEMVQKIFADMHALNKGQAIPRYQIVTEPHVHPNMETRGLVHLAFPFRRGYSYQDIPYILLLSFQTAPMEEILKQLTVGSEQYVQGYIEGSDGKILLHTNGKDLFGTSAAAWGNRQKLSDLSVPVGKFGWKLHTAIDEKQILATVNASYRPVLLMYFILILLILGLLFWACRHTLQPLYLIGESIAKVQNGQSREAIPIQGCNEIWQLADSYNQMLHAITQAEEEVAYQHTQAIDNMKMKQRAEREALESQINAHFICNTINAINYEAIESGNYKVSTLLKKLSNTLRYTFDQKHQNVYMRQEIVWVEQYLYLQRERLESVFDYEIDFDPDYDSWPCRKLMLQPFVENSILHGFEGRREGGFIRICGEGYREFLRITIEDNGCGMNVAQRDLIHEVLRNPGSEKKCDMGIGIRNVITRMKMYYGEDFQTELETEEGKGTKFTFILPMPQQEQKIKPVNGSR